MATFIGPMTMDGFNSIVMKQVVDMGIVVDDPFKPIYENLKASALTVNLPFALPVGGMVRKGESSGKGIYGKAPDANVRAKYFSVTSDTFGRNFPVDMDLVTTDQAGVYAKLPRQIKFAMDSHWPSLATDLLVGGFAGGATPVSEIDNQHFFSATHSLVGAPTINNVSTAALSTGSYTTATQALDSYYVVPDEYSRPQMLNRGTRKLLMVGPSNKILARNIVDREKGTFGEDLVLNKDAEIVVNPWLTGATANYWFLFAVGGMSSAILKWERINPQLLFFNEKNSRECAESRQWEYVTHLCGNIHMLYWHTVYGSTGATPFIPSASIPVNIV
jgi:hypothetical protein